MAAEPFCPHFGSCGGCAWQDVDYAEQLERKRRRVEAALEKVPGFDLAVPPVVPSDSLRGFRNKVEFTFAAGSALGFHPPRDPYRVLDLSVCHLQRDPSDAIRRAVRDHAVAAGIPFFDRPNRRGVLRNLILRTTTAGDVMVVLVLFEEDARAAAAVLDHVAERFPSIVSLHWVAHQEVPDKIGDAPVRHHRGATHLVERLGDLEFRIGPKTFFQPNTPQALRLYRAIAAWSGLGPDDVAYDLCTGAGTIALSVAPLAGRVVGFETVPEAVADARANAEANGIRNVEFRAGDVADLLEAAAGGDVVIADPGRTGLPRKAVDRLAAMAPRRILYASCAVETQARDVSRLPGWRAVHVQPFDMVPHTPHVENLVVLDRVHNGTR